MLFLFFLSGSLGLIYEVVWLRMLILVFGSTQFAVSTVLTAFMAGLGLGAYVVGRWIDRRWSPLTIYGLFEIGIGLYALAIPWMFGLLQPVSRWLWDTFQPTFFGFSLIRFVFVGALLIVPTSLMGGTLPALSRFVTRRRERIGLSVGSLYGVNTFGAVAGTAATGFLLVPWLGVQETIRVAATLNVVVGLAALGLAAVRRRAAARAARERTAGRAGISRAPGPSALPWRIRAVLAAFAASGFIAMIYEIAWTRVLALVIGSSVYAFTIMLATFLTGLALGTTLMSWLADRIGAKRGLDGVAVLLGGTGATAFVTLRLLHELPYWFSLAFHAVGAGGPHGGGTWPLFGVKFFLAGVVMLPPTLFLGGMFPLVVRICGDALRAVGRTVGTAYAANTFGTILGSALGGFVIVPLLGLQGSIMSAILLDLILAAALVAMGGRGRLRLASIGACVAAAAGFWIAQPAWDALLMNSGIFAYVTGMKDKDRTPGGFERFARRGKDLVYYEEGITATVMVAKNPDKGHNLFMSVNGKVDGSSEGDIQTQLLSAHVPMLLADDPEHVLVIGYATGMTVGAASLYPVDKVTTVEIEPAVIDASRKFRKYNHDPLSNDRVDVVTGDGRNFLLMTDKTYDVIISEPSNPWMTIASNLFTRQFFELGRSRLNEGGIFCGWVQLYGLRPDVVRMLVRTFSSVFPHVSVYMPIPYADLILLGSDEPIVPDIRKMASLMAEPAIAHDLERIGVEDVPDLLSYRVMGNAGARALAGRGPLNTDDNARIEFRAPLSFYAGTRVANAKALVPYISDPLAHATHLPKKPAKLAGVYRELGEAFYQRQMAGRAVKAFQKAQKLHPTEKVAERILEVRSWYAKELRERSAEAQAESR